MLPSALSPMPLGSVTSSGSSTVACRIRIHTMDILLSIVHGGATGEAFDIRDLLS